jgi:hypothetical protein
VPGIDELLQSRLAPFPLLPLSGQGLCLSGLSRDALGALVHELRPQAGNLAMDGVASLADLTDCSGELLQGLSDGVRVRGLIRPPLSGSGSSGLAAGIH